MSSVLRRDIPRPAAETIMLTGGDALEPHLAELVEHNCKSETAFDDPSGTLTVLLPQIESKLHRDPGPGRELVIGSRFEHARLEDRWCCATYRRTSDGAGGMRQHSIDLLPDSIRLRCQARARTGQTIGAFVAVILMWCWWRHMVGFEVSQDQSELEQMRQQADVVLVWSEESLNSASNITNPRIIWSSIAAWPAGRCQLGSGNDHQRTAGQRLA